MVRQRRTPRPEGLLLRGAASPAQPTPHRPMGVQGELGLGIALKKKKEKQSCVGHLVRVHVQLPPSGLAPVCLCCRATHKGEHQQKPCPKAEPVSYGSRGACPARARGRGIGGVRAMDRPDAWAMPPSPRQTCWRRALQMSAPMIRIQQNSFDGTQGASFGGPNRRLAVPQRNVPEDTAPVLWGVSPYHGLEHGP